MPGVEHEDQDERTLLEVVLRMHGDFRSRLASIGVTPLQAGVMLNLQRHSDAKMKTQPGGLRYNQGLDCGEAEIKVFTDTHTPGVPRPVC